MTIFQSELIIVTMVLYVLFVQWKIFFFVLKLNKLPDLEKLLFYIFRAINRRKNVVF